MLNYLRYLVQCHYNLLLTMTFIKFQRDENKAGTVSPHSAPNWTELLKKLESAIGKQMSGILSCMTTVCFQSLRRLNLLIFSIAK